eukprot:8134208-Ditylum_brightwellii.AAC.1
MGNPVRLVLAPWFDNFNTKPTQYSALSNMTHIANKLQWVDVRELIFNGYFRYRENKNGTEEQRHNVNIGVLYNGSINFREEVKKSL